MPDNSNIPTHIAIILDGNRRFAKRLLLEPWRGHEFGKEKVIKLLENAKDLGIKELTFYALSCENIKSRPKEELNYLLDLMKKAFKELEEDKEKIKENKIKIKFIGNLSLLPKDLQDQCKRLENQTKENNNFIVNFAIAYGGRQEIVEAVKKILNNKILPNNITEDLIQKNLYLQDEPDIVIRTGGVIRTSNFLPWQTTYSEWFFLDKLWPEFEKEDLIKCIEEFKTRKRNFGS